MHTLWAQTNPFYFNTETLKRFRKVIFCLKIIWDGEWVIDLKKIYAIENTSSFSARLMISRKSNEKNRCLSNYSCLKDNLTRKIIRGLEIFF